MFESRNPALEALHAVITAMSEAPSELEAMLCAALKTIVGYTGVDMGGVFLPVAGGELESAAMVGGEWPHADANIVLCLALFDKMNSSGHVGPLFLSSPTEIARWSPEHELPDGIGGMAILPLRAHGRSLGVMVLGAGDGSRLAGESRRWLTQVSTLLGLAIECADSSERFITSLRETHDRIANLMQAVIQIGREVAGILDVSAMLITVATRLMDMFGYLHAAVGLVEGDELHIYFGSRSPMASFGPAPFRRPLDGQGLTTWVARNAVPLLVRDVSKDDRYVPGPGLEACKAELVVPLIHGERVLGILDVQDDEPDTLDEDVLQAMSALAGQVAATVENARLYEETRRRASEVTALLATSEALSSTLALGERLEIIAKRAKYLLDADNAVLFLLDDDGETLRPAVALHEYADKVMHSALKIGEGLTGHVVLYGEGCIVGNSLEDPRVHYVPGTPMEQESLISVPLRVEEHVLGAMTMSRMGANAFDDGDLRLLNTFASLASMAIANSRLYEESKRQRQLAETLNRISRMVGSTLDPQEVMDAVLAELSELVEYDSASVLLLNDEDMLEMASSIGYPAKAARYLNGNDLSHFPNLQWVMQHRKLLVIPDTSRSDEWINVPGLAHVKSWIGAPLNSRGRLVGVLTVESVVPLQYGPGEGEVVEAFANQVSVAIDNAILFSRIEKQERESRTLYTISRLLNSFDYTGIPLSVLEKLQGVIRFDVGGILVIEEEVARVFVMATRPISAEIVAEIEDRLLEAYEQLSRVGLGMRSVERTIDGPVVDRADAAITRLEARLSAPLIATRHILGAIELASVDPDAFEPDRELPLLFAVANHLATALDNAQLHMELNSRVQELQAAYDRMEEEQKLKEDMVQTVSHEIRNPLTFIKSYGQLLLEEELTPSQRHALELIVDKAEFIEKMVEDVISLKRISRDALELVEVDLVELARNAVESARIAASNSGIEIALEHDPDVPTIMGDPMRLTQVFQNLLSNAVKFSPFDTTVTVRVRSMGDKVRVEVADQGIGIPEDKLERIFERFYQVKDNRLRARGGIGLGLAISKQIVEAHGGRIWATSELGKGSTFYFELHRARENGVSGNKGEDS